MEREKDSLNLLFREKSKSAVFLCLTLLRRICCMRSASRYFGEGFVGGKWVLVSVGVG
jgi:hypothetical protein